ncbi:MAG: hypothetical protein QM601_07210 [Pseudoxanthomonas sp.]
MNVATIHREAAWLSALANTISYSFNGAATTLAEKGLIDLASYMSERLYVALTGDPNNDRSEPGQLYTNEVAGRLSAITFALAALNRLSLSGAEDESDDFNNRMCNHAGWLQNCVSDLSDELVRRTAQLAGQADARGGVENPSQ